VPNAATYDGAFPKHGRPNTKYIAKIISYGNKGISTGAKPPSPTHIPHMRGHKSIYQNIYSFIDSIFLGDFWKTI
jgi:hypothetical protein